MSLTQELLFLRSVSAMDPSGRGGSGCPFPSAAAFFGPARSWGRPPGENDLGTPLRPGMTPGRHADGTHTAAPEIYDAPIDLDLDLSLGTRRAPPHSSRRVPHSGFLWSAQAAVGAVGTLWGRRRDAVEGPLLDLNAAGAESEHFCTVATSPVCSSASASASAAPSRAMGPPWLASAVGEKGVPAKIMVAAHEAHGLVEAEKTVPAAGKGSLSKRAWPPKGRETAEGGDANSPQDPTAEGGAGSPGAAASVPESLAASRYEKQKQRDWKTFNMYLRNVQPPVEEGQFTGQHVVEFLAHLDQFGRTKVHEVGCPFYGTPGHRACACPMRQAWGSLDSLIGRLRAAYEESGGRVEANPFAERVVRAYLRKIRESQAKARGTESEAKKRRRRRSGEVVDDRVAAAARIELSGETGSGTAGVPQDVRPAHTVSRALDLANLLIPNEVLATGKDEQCLPLPKRLRSGVERGSSLSSEVGRPQVLQLPSSAVGQHASFSTSLIDSRLLTTLHEGQFIAGPGSQSHHEQLDERLILQLLRQHQAVAASQREDFLVDRK